jgi:hypothetical protein
VSYGVVDARDRKRHASPEAAAIAAQKNQR